MTFEASLYYELTHNAGVAALVAARITPLFAPDFPENTSLNSVQPHLIYSLRNADVEYGTQWARITETVDILCCANSFDSMLVLAEAVIDALQARSDVFGGVGGVQVSSCLLQGYSDDSSYELGLFARRLSFAVQRILT